jgi:hypothetical protein
VRSSSLSSGWSIDVSNTVPSQVASTINSPQSDRKRGTKIKRLVRHTPRRIPPRNAPVHPVLKSSQSYWSASFKNKAI